MTESKTSAVKTKAALLSELEELQRANLIYRSKGASVTENERAKHQLRQHRLRAILAEIDRVAAQSTNTANCERLPMCPFFTGKMPSLDSLMKATYCYGDKTQCARYQVFIASVPVPLDLLPNDRERAQQLLSSRAIK